jgi:fucose permease
LEEASIFVASTFVGYLSGAVISGIIYERMNPYLILFIGLMIMASTSASIPFCIIYEVMLLMHLLKGIGVGLLDAGLSYVSFLSHDINWQNQNLVQI